MDLQEVIKEHREKLSAEKDLCEKATSVFLNQVVGSDQFNIETVIQTSNLTELRVSFPQKCQENLPHIYITLFAYARVRDSRRSIFHILSNKYLHNIFWVVESCTQSNTTWSFNREKSSDLDNFYSLITDQITV